MGPKADGERKQLATQGRMHNKQLSSPKKMPHKKPGKSTDEFSRKKITYRKEPPWGSTTVKIGHPENERTFRVPEALDTDKALNSARRKHSIPLPPPGMFPQVGCKRHPGKMGFVSVDFPQHGAVGAVDTTDSSVPASPALGSSSPTTTRAVVADRPCSGDAHRVLSEPHAAAANLLALAQESGGATPSRMVKNNQEQSQPGEQPRKVQNSQEPSRTIENRHEPSRTVNNSQET